MSGRNVGVLLSIPVHVLLSVRVVVVLERKRGIQEDGTHSGNVSKVSAQYRDWSTFAVHEIYLGVGVVVKSCDWVIIVARAFIVLVCGHIWDSCGQRKDIY